MILKKIWRISKFSQIYLSVSCWTSTVAIFLSCYVEWNISFHAGHNASDICTSRIILHFKTKVCPFLLILINKYFWIYLTDYLTEDCPLSERITYVTHCGINTLNLNILSISGVSFLKFWFKRWDFRQKSCINIMISKSYPSPSTLVWLFFVTTDILCFFLFIVVSLVSLLMW